MECTGCGSLDLNPVMPVNVCHQRSDYTFLRERKPVVSERAAGGNCIGETRLETVVILHCTTQDRRGLRRSSFDTAQHRHLVLLAIVKTDPRLTYNRN